MVFTNITPFPRTLTPVTNISPLTYRDAATFLEYLETIKQWLNETLVPDSNEMITNAITEFQEGIVNAEATVIATQGGWQGQWNTWTAEKAEEYLAFVASIDAAHLAFTEAINADFTSFTNSVNQNMTDATTDIEATKTGWQNSWNAFIANVEMEIAAISDSAAAGLVETPASELAQALNVAYVPRGAAETDVEFYHVNGEPDDTAKIQRAIAALTAGDQANVLRLRANKTYTVSGTLNVNVGKLSIVGYQSVIIYTGTAVLFQLTGNATVSSHGTPWAQGLRLFGPGRATTSVAVKMNTDDAVAIGSYVAGHPMEHCVIREFGTGILYSHMAWGNTLKSCFIDKNGIGFLVPAGLTPNMGERLAFEDCTLAENDVAYEVRSGGVELNFTNCSLDYNKIAGISSRNSHFVNCHIETNRSQWVAMAGHFQHTALGASTNFSDCTMVFSDIHTEPFEPYNVGTLSQIYLYQDRFTFDRVRWSLTWAADFTSRLLGWTRKRLVNEIAGNRNLKRGMFGLQIHANAPEPIFGGSLIPGRNQSNLSLPTADITSVEAVTTTSISDDLIGVAVPSRTVTVPPAAVGTNSLNVKFRVPVGPTDYGKRILIRMKADLTAAGPDTQRSVYVNYLANNAVSLGSALAWPGMSNVVAGTTNNVELFPGYADGTIPTGCDILEFVVQFTNIKANDTYKLYQPLLNLI